jgi:regulator of sirC expression with transglutaminase-like and TPR domain
MTTIIDRAERIASLAASDRLAEAALELARFQYPALDPSIPLGAIAALAARVNGDTHLSLRRVIAIAEGYGGNVDDYSNPDKSFLNRVIETRRGIPISLSILWIEVGRLAGIEMVGVGLPGHFVVYAGGQMVDPFHYGEAIGFDEAASLVAAALGGSPRLDRSWLSPVGPVAVIDRLAGNLETIYENARDGANLEWVKACRLALSAALS